MCFLCRRQVVICKKRGKKITKHALKITFSLTRIFILFACTHYSAPSVINIGNNPTELLTLSLYISHITQYTTLMGLNIYWKMQ